MNAKGALGLVVCASTMLVTAAAWGAGDEVVSPYKTSPSAQVLAQDINQAGNDQALVNPLKLIRSSMGQMRDNNMEANASLNPGMQDEVLSDNRWLLNTTMMQIARVLEAMHATGAPGAMTKTDMRSSTTDSTIGAEWGSADQRMHATESNDSAFIRNALQDLNTKLNGYSLRGDPYVAVSHKDMNLIDAAIAHAENPAPDRSVAYNAYKSRLDSMESKVLSEQAQVAQAPPTPPSVTNETRTETTTTPAPAPAPEAAPAPLPAPEATPAPAPAPENNATTNTSTESTTTTTETSAAGEGGGSLPRTGGEPLVAYAFGSLLIGLGSRLRRRR